MLFYMQRSGSLAETNEYLKLGRVRLRLDPNPFGAPGAEFRQELKLRDGYVEIEGGAAGPDGKPIKSSVRIWVEVHRPVIHLEVESTRAVHARASYDNWCLQDETITARNRSHSFITLPDWRRWGGGVFTAQNQRLLYWPMLKSGDADAIIPQFELYRKAGCRG